ncbi:MAG: Coq4 family protein, partial [Bacteroidota bacterium]
MKTVTDQPKTLIDHLMFIHLKTSSWVAGLIGPMVFNYGTNQKNWNLTTEGLLQYPEGSVGKELGKFLKKSGVEPLVGAEYHDLEHVLFDYSISFKDEVGLQFFLHGNGKKSFASVSTIMGAWFILPTQWKYLKNSYVKGKKCKDISKLNLKDLLNDNLNQVKASLYP